MAEDLVLPVPGLLSATYVVPTALEGDAAKARITAAFEGRVGGPLPHVASKLFDAGAARLVSMESVPPLPVGFQQYLGVPRETLPAVRTRFMEGSIPLHARLMIKFRLQAPDGSEYPWAYVNSWKDPATVSAVPHPTLSVTRRDARAARSSSTPTRSWTGESGSTAMASSRADSPTPWP